jgi:hypothetical protein
MLRAPGECAIVPEAMIDVLTRRTPAAERQRVLLAVMSDPRCRQEFDLLRAIVTEAPGATRFRPERSRAPILAIALVVLLAAAAYAGRGWLPIIRAQLLQQGRTAFPLQLVAPRAGENQAAGLTFIWRSIPGATNYEFNLVTRNGRMILLSTVNDTTLTLADSIALNAEEDYRWWVEATGPDGKPQRSEVRSLRIAAR